MSMEDEIVKLDMEHKRQAAENTTVGRTIVAVVFLLCMTTIGCCWAPEDPSVIWRCTP